MLSSQEETDCRWAILVCEKRLQQMEWELAQLQEKLVPLLKQKAVLLRESEVRNVSNPEEFGVDTFTAPERGYTSPCSASKVLALHLRSKYALSGLRYHTSPKGHGPAQS